VYKIHRERTKEEENVEIEIAMIVFMNKNEMTHPNLCHKTLSSNLHFYAAAVNQPWK
jgi:hypothetical protein